MNKPTIICVDDEIMVLTSLRSYLSECLGNDYTIEIAESAEEALEVFSELVADNTEVPLIISDQIMPGIKGDQLLAKIHNQYPKVLKILLTGQATAEAVGNAVNQANLYRYISKPWEGMNLGAVVQEALQRYFHDKDLTEVNRFLADLNAGLEAKVTERTEALAYRVKLEQLISRISSQFIGLAHREVDAGIETALQQLGEFAEVDRCYLFQVVVSGSHFSNTHEWCAPGIEPQKSQLQNLPIATFAWFMEQLQQAEMIYLSSLEDLPTVAAVERQELTRQGIQSLLCVPILLQNQVFGFIGFDAVRQAKTWTPEDANALRLVGEIFANTLKRQQTEASLRQTEELFRRAFDDAPIGIALVGLEGQLRQVNRSLCEILGYPESALLGRRLQEITEPTDREIDRDLIEQILAGSQRTYQLEKRYCHRDGRTVWGLLNVSLVRDNADRPLYFVVQIQDISDRHALNRMKDEFISIVSHELRTPLTAIHGSLGILASGTLEQDPETTRQMLQVAYKSSDRLVRLVNDILTLDRYEPSHGQLKLEVCQVSSLMQQAVEAMQAIADQKGIQLQIEPFSLQIQVDADAIIQTLINLLSNAIKFSDRGSIVWLSAEILPGSHPALPSYLRVAVQDQGRGIPADKLESIFERFQQVDASDSRQKGGTGLGLAICKTIIQGHGGQIWAESVLGTGSTFYFTLPLSENVNPI